jgi:hypothetical protein
MASDPAAMAAYSSRARQDAASDAGMALEAPGFGAAAAYGQTNPYAPSPSDNDTLPPQITGVGAPQPSGGALAYDGSGGAGAGLQASQQGIGTPQDLGPPTAPPQAQSKGFLGLSPDFYQSLMAAGLGMAASRSPFAGVAAGEGGLQGLQTYEGLQKQHLEEQKQSQDVDLKVKQLNQQAKSE